MLEVAIVLPAYNEEQTIAGTVTDFYVQMPQANFVIVNNASSDNTAAVARGVLRDLGARGMVLDEPRSGKGNAVRRGFSSVDADIYVMVDADMTYNAADLPALIKPVEENEADMIVGDRMSHGHYSQENKRRFHGLGNILVCWLVNLIFKSRLADIMSGYRVLSRTFVKSYPILVEGFQIETDMTLHALDKRFRVGEVPVQYRDRPAGSQSKLNTFHDGARVLMTIFRIFRYYRPLMFFGTISLLLFVSSLLAGAPVIDDWLQHRYIYHVPLAILASGLILLSALSMLLGIILDAIDHQNRMNFEREIHMGVMSGNGTEPKNS